MAIKELTFNIEFMGAPYIWGQTDILWGEMDFLWGDAINIGDVMIFNLFNMYKWMLFKNGLTINKKAVVADLVVKKNGESILSVIKET